MIFPLLDVLQEKVPGDQRAGRGIKQVGEIGDSLLPYLSLGLERTQSEWLGLGRGSHIIVCNSQLTTARSAIVSWCSNVMPHFMTTELNNSRKGSCKLRTLYSFNILVGGNYSPYVFKISG